MKKLMTLIVVFLLLATFLLPGCGENSSLIEASLDKEFTMAIGQTAFIESEDLRLTFKDVTDDSRCPRNAECIWAGIANCVMQISIAGTPDNFALIQPGGGYLNETSEFGEYTISFNLKPYPDLSRQIQKSDYFMEITIRKNTE